MLIPAVPTELLPSISERKFLVTFLNGSGTPATQLMQLKPVVDDSVSRAIGTFTYTAQADAKLTQFMITSSTPQSDAVTRIELALIDHFAATEEKARFHVSEFGSGNLPTAEVLVIPKVNITHLELEAEVDRLRDELQNSEAVGDIQVLGKQSTLQEAKPSASTEKNLNEWIEEHRRRNTTFQYAQPMKGSPIWWSPPAERDESTVWTTRTQTERLVQLDGKAAAGLAIFRAPGADDIEVSAALNATLKAFHSDHIETRIIRDSSIYISQAEDNVSKNLLMGVALTCLSILIFIRRLWSTVIVAMAIPVTLLLSIPVLFAFGITRNVMSLAGVALGVGIVVDASLSTMHSFNERLQKGFLPMQAAKYACTENQIPLLMTGLTTLAVFIPILTLDGQVGDLFSELSITVITGQVIGFFVSVYLTPSVACLLHEKKETHLWIDRKPDPRSDASHAPSAESPQRLRIEQAMQQLLRRPYLCFVLNALLICIIILNLFNAPPSEFLPAGNNSQYRTYVPLRGEVSPAQRATLIMRIEDFLKSQGFTDRYLTASPFEISVLAGRSEAPDLNVLNEGLESVIFPQRGGIFPLNPLEPKSGQGEDVELFTHPGDRAKVREMLSRIQAEPGVASAQFSGDQTERYAQLNAKQSSLYAVWVPQIAEADFRRSYLDTIPLGFSTREQKAIGGPASTFQPGAPYYFPGKRGDGPSQSLPKTRALPLSVLNQREEPLLSGPAGSLLTREVFESDVTVELRDAITHLIPSGFADKVTLDIEGITSSEAEALIRHHATEMLLPFQWHPKTEESRKGFSDLLACLAAAVAIIITLIYLQSWSLRVSLIVLCTFLWGPIGSIPGLLLHDESLNASAVVGFILLAGTIVNNGILLIEAIERKRRAQIGPIEACILGVKERVVNVTITSLTTILGMLPMVFETGAGSQMYRGLAIVVVYGTLISTPISLIGVPSLFILFGSIRETIERMVLRTRVALAAAASKRWSQPQ